MKNSDIHLRSIQHYLYCPHRWGLIELDCSFAENAFVYKGNRVHENVDNKKGTITRGTFHENSVQVYSDQWGIMGVVDCLELRPDKQGVAIIGKPDKYRLTIVEYKASAPKKEAYHQTDLLQLLGQKICVDELFSTDCDTCFYFADTKKRVPVTFSTEDYDQLKLVLQEMRTLRDAGTIPPIAPDQHCSGCSMKDICMPPKKVKKT